MAQGLTFLTDEIQKLIFNKLKILWFSERQSCKWLIKIAFIKAGEERGWLWLFSWGFQETATAGPLPELIGYLLYSGGKSWLPLAWGLSFLSKPKSFWKVKLIFCVSSLSYHIKTHCNAIFPRNQVQYSFSSFTPVFLLAWSALFSLFLCLFLRASK